MRARAVLVVVLALIPSSRPAVARMQVRPGVALDADAGVVLTLPATLAPLPPGPEIAAIVRGEDALAPVDLQGSREMTALGSGLGAGQPSSAAGATPGAKKAGITPPRPGPRETPIGRYSPLAGFLAEAGGAAGPGGDVVVLTMVPAILASNATGAIEATATQEGAACPGPAWSTERVAGLEEWSVRVLRCAPEDALQHVVALAPSPQRDQTLLVVAAHAGAPLDLGWDEVVGMLRSVRWAMPSSRPAVLARDAARKALAGGEAQAALDAWSKVLAREPQCWQAEAGRGDALLALGRVDEGRAALERAAEIEPRDFTVLRGRLVAALGAGDDALADRLAPEAARVLADDAVLQAALGERALERGDASGALAHLDLAAASQPDDPGVHRLRARAEEALGASAAAVEAWCRCQEAARVAGASAVRLEALKALARLVAAHPDLAPDPANPGSACP